MAVTQAIATPVWELQFPYANGNDGKGNIDTLMTMAIITS